MPSGAKKRKAAKKKKGGDQSNNSSNPSSASTYAHGKENVDFKEGGEGQIEVENNVVRVEREFKIEDGSDKKDGGSSGSSNSDSGSSSDEESPAIKNTQASEEIPTVLDSLKEGESMSESPAEAIQCEPIKEASVSIVENIPSSDLLVEKVEVAPLVKSAVEENWGKSLSSVEEDKVGPSVVSVDAIVQSVEKNEAIPDPKECVIQENDDKLIVSFNAPTPTDDDGEREKVSGVTEPLLATHPVQRTSWKSCCGLFEVFSGSRS